MTPTEDRAKVTKKVYEAPAVRRVRLVVEDAVLAVCHSSTKSTPSSVPNGCQGNFGGCYKSKI
jgi:hypothetical protein